MDSDIGKILLTLLADGPNTLCNDLKDWRVETVDGNNVLYYKDRAYVPKDQTLRQDLLRMSHMLTTMYSVTQCSEPIQCSDLYGGSGSARSSADVHIRQGYTVCEKDGASESARQR